MLFGNSDEEMGISLLELRLPWYKYFSVAAQILVIRVLDNPDKIKILLIFYLFLFIYFYLFIFCLYFIYSFYSFIFIYYQISLSDMYSLLKNPCFLHNFILTNRTCATTITIFITTMKDL